MTSYRKEASVGMIVLVGVVLFIAGSFWLSGKGWGEDDVYVVYHDIKAMKDASTVRISGAPVGRVDGIHYISPGRVVVGLKLDDGVTLTSGATATIVPFGMLGDRMIEVVPGTGTPLQKGDTIEGSVTNGIFDKAAEIAAQASEMMTRINAMLDTGLVKQLRATLASTQSLMAYLADRKNGPVAQVTPTLLALQKTSARLDTALAGLDVAQLQARLDSTMQSAGDAADQLAALSARADTLMGRIQHGNGTLGKFINDTSFYTDLRHTMQAMTDLLNEIKKNPGKIGVTVRIP